MALKTFTFEDLPSFELIRGLYKYGFEVPSPVQELAIPPMLQGRSISVSAQTGSGKTAAFGVAVLSHVTSKRRACQAVVISPTKEISKQTYQVLIALSRYLDIEGVCLTSGMAGRQEFTALRRGAQFACITPKRLIQLLSNIDSASLRCIVLDECDRLFDGKFEGHVTQLLRLVPNAMVYCFSATATPAYKAHIEGLVPNIQHIDVYAQRLDKFSITHFIVHIGSDEEDTLIPLNTACLEPVVKRTSARKKKSRHSFTGPNTNLRPVHDTEDPDLQAKKVRALLHILYHVPIVQGIIFCRSRGVADTVHHALHEAIACGCVHAGIEHTQRDLEITKFRTGRTRILVTTDLLARGFDVRQVTFVCHFDAPRTAEIYMHRAGRCGRFGRLGLSVLLASPAERALEAEVQTKYGVSFSAISLAV
ncbi:Eukaryotic initiation factor 4A [Giardia muris]|uniref:Eukaryotic initiation factor 4A n=1 Tax=Giardia muris TaxID=5742 RepID=A0A4Z1SMY1_GIAMU|nr:Eukaryotic initiation factor 4A [Giardia muris]|eukprot:TNJ26185.1 Eukaryotic initiation factor 4A [Giardia muris]